LGTSRDEALADVNLLAFSHYLQALGYQRKALQVVGILGSKTPHIQTLTVGGVTNAIDLDSQAALGIEKPLEVLRTIHSFDPCMACACHTFDPEGKRIADGITAESYAAGCNLSESVRAAIDSAVQQVLSELGRLDISHKKKQASPSTVWSSTVPHPQSA
jgi:hypothetical protein